MMTDLVEFINELVDDQIQMKSCIPLTTELEDFYSQLMGRNIHMNDDDSDDDDRNDDDGKNDNALNSVERFLKPRKRFTRKTVRNGN